MSFAIFKGETKMKDLLTRLFRMPDSSTKTMKQTTDALLQANPQLKDLSKVAVGSVINIPFTAPPLNPSEEAPASVSRQVAITRPAQQSLYILNLKLADIDARAAEGATAFLSLAQSRQMQALAQNSAELKAQLPALIASAQAMVRAVEAQRERRSATIANLQKDLQMLPQTKI
jgi:hypothetical protein